MDKVVKFPIPIRWQFFAKIRLYFSKIFLVVYSFNKKKSIWFSHRSNSISYQRLALLSVDKCLYLPFRDWSLSFCLVFPFHSKTSIRSIKDRHVIAKVTNFGKPQTCLEQRTNARFRLTIKRKCICCSFVTPLSPVWLKKYFSSYCFVLSFLPRISSYFDDQWRWFVRWLISR